MLDKTHTDTWITRSIRLSGTKYKTYLKSDEWKRIRRKALERSYYKKCFTCGSPNNIQLHHRSYKWIGTPFAMRGLVPLCGKCHQKVHRIAKRSGKSVRLATKRLIRNTRHFR